MAAKIAVVVAKDRSPTPEQETLQDRLMLGLERRPEFDVTVVPHLYDLPPGGRGVQFLRGVAGDLVVFSWLYPRSAYWVLDSHGIRGRLGRTTSLHEADDAPAASRTARGVPDRTLWCFDLRQHARPEPYLAEIDRILLGRAREAAHEPLPLGPDGAVKIVEETTQPRWYPVIDFDRCSGCLECLNFCLFGVFGLDETESVVIEQPDACRHGCPACSRICPQGAILFPQHKDPAIAGDPQAPPGGLKLDLSQLFGGASPLELAAKERRRALAEQKDREKDAASPKASLQKPDPAPPSAGPNGLDSLVDGLENLDL